MGPVCVIYTSPPTLPPYPIPLPNPSATCWHSRSFCYSEKITFLEISDMRFIVVVEFGQYSIIFWSISFQKDINAKGKLHFARERSVRQNMTLMFRGPTS